LQRYDWPGNVRELQNVLTRLAVHTLSRKTEITPEDVRRILSVGASSQSALLGMEPLTDGFQLERALDRVRYYYVQEARKKSKNTSETARLLGYDNRTPLRTILKNLKEAGFRIDD
jgi:DNA-binding NtrC family response regulator